MAPAKKIEKPRPTLVSLGPVMNDDILKTLVDTRTESSQSFYRRPSDLLPAENLPVQKVEAFVSGDVVSLPENETVSSALRQSLAGSKSSPDFDWDAGS